MTKKNIFLVIAVVMILVTMSACGKKTTPLPTQTPNVQNEIQTPRGSDMLDVKDDRMSDPEEQKAEDVQENLNALDYMAPGHKKARERVKQVQELRQKALDEQQKDLEKLNLR